MHMKNFICGDFQYKTSTNIQCVCVFDLKMLQSEKRIDFNKLSVDSSIKLFWLAIIIMIAIYNKDRIIITLIDIFYVNDIFTDKFA